MLLLLPRYLRTKHENHEKGGGRVGVIRLFLSFSRLLPFSPVALARFCWPLVQRAARCTCSLPRSGAFQWWKALRAPREGNTRSSLPPPALFLSTLFPPFFSRSTVDVDSSSFSSLGASIELSLNGERG